MWIKICGVTSVDDATMIAQAGADAIGLNFYAKSSRYIAPETARIIRDAVADRVGVVGVFVNSSADEVATIAQQVGLNTVQFHGDEPADVIAEFHCLCPDVGIVRAFRVGSEGIASLQQSLRELIAIGIPLTAILVDALVAGEYGGTGRQVNPEWLHGRPETWPPMILAGGLTPATVSAAIQSVRPWGVDTASGVEQSPGVKDADKVQQFIRAVCDSPNRP
ncbi:MAG: phosphoribosylanthranilate isomerase [Planctomycetaceae bacterium]